MTERAELMRIYRSNGISSISLMRDHYNKYDDGGDIQPSDATFRATLTNPVNSYRSNAPAGIGDAAITKATGLLNPITAATLTAAPLGAISKINAAAKAYKAAKIANPIKESDLFITQRGEGSVPYIFKRLQKENPSAVGEAIQQLTTLEQSRRDRIQEAARYYQNIQDRAKIGATVAGAGLGAYGIYKAIENKKAFGGNIYDGKSTKSNQMNPSSFKVDPENTSLLKVLQTQPNQPVDSSNSLNNLDSYRYQIPTYIEVENQKVPLVRYKTDLEKEMIPKISEEYYNRIEKDNIINPEFMRVEKNIENESKEGYKNGRWYPHLSPEGGAKTIGYGDKLVPSYEYKRDRAFIKRAHAEGISDEEANNRLNYNLKVSLDAVRKDIINKYGYEAWDTMYPSLKRGLTDIRFNVGPNKEYPKATEAAIRNNIEQFMKEQKDGRSPRRVDSINTLFIDQLKNL